MEFFNIAWIAAGRWKAFGFLLEKDEDSFRFRESLKKGWKEREGEGFEGRDNVRATRPK